MRRAVATGAALAGLLLAACQEPATDSGDGLPDCSADQCSGEVAAMAREVADLEGVARVFDATYNPDQITDGPSVTLRFQVTSPTSAACSSIESDLARIGWESAVSPLNSATWQCFAAGASPGQDVVAPGTLETLSVDYVGDKEVFEEKWGHRH